MADDDYFSFGDEDLGDSELDLADLRGGSPDGVLAPAGMTTEGPVGDVGSGFAAKSAARPRGGSEKGSSGRRPARSRRTRVIAALAIGLIVILLVRTGISALVGGEASDRSRARATEARPSTPPANVFDARRRAAAHRASRERASERQRARQHRAQTRHRARRRRQHAKGRRERKATQEEAAAAAQASAPAPEYLPPAFEPAPPPSTAAPEPAPSGAGRIHDGANSPEFGL